jgi:hypothetical protein
MNGTLKRSVVGALISVIVTAAILEGALRLIPDNAPIPYRQLTGDENFGPEPNETARSLYGTLYRTHSRGLPGPERSPARTAGRARVAVAESLHRPGG